MPLIVANAFSRRAAADHECRKNIDEFP